MKALSDEKIREFDLGGLTYLRPLQDPAGEWYYALNYPDGDLYEAEEIHAEGGALAGSLFYLLRYPDGEVIKPLERKADTVIGEPVYYGGVISFPSVDFTDGMIRIWRFSCSGRTLREAAALPLSSVKDCYNLRLHEHPLTLSRQPNDGSFELLWPERKTFAVRPTESFFHRDGRRLFFGDWKEDPDYREETVIRDAETGEELERLPGDITVMPNGELWHLKGLAPDDF